jgi:hypothetical protein
MRLSVLHVTSPSGGVLSGWRVGLAALSDEACSARGAVSQADLRCVRLPTLHVGDDAVRILRVILTILALLLCVSCSGTRVDTPSARPYEVVGGLDLSPTTGRTARHWYIVSQSATFEEHAQTVARAPLDLEREHRMDLTYVSLYPSRSLAGSGVQYGYGFYATDGRAGQGLSGADPDYRARWRVFAADRVLTAEELAIGELWVERAEDFRSQDMLSNLAIDSDALRTHISEELQLPYETVQLPHLALELWLEVLE